MRTSYDPRKRVANLKKQGLDFEDARKVIKSDGTVIFEERRQPYNEQRFIPLGTLRGPRRCYSGLTPGRNCIPVRLISSS
jgi:uncharacterized DUF497 family protein